MESPGLPSLWRRRRPFMATVLLRSSRWVLLSASFRRRELRVVQLVDVRAEHRAVVLAHRAGHVQAVPPRHLLLDEEPERLDLGELVPRAPRARRSDVLHRGARETGALSDRVLVLLVRVLHAKAERGGQPPEGQA